MKYLGERGGKAEVNDAGRIRRLPFAGQGVPPEPGTTVNPARDSCCCPKNVSLKKEDLGRGGQGDIRRQVVNTPQDYVSDIRLVSAFTASFRKKDNPDYIGGSITEGALGRFRNLIGLPYKFLLYRYDGLYVPFFEKWVEWNSKTNEFKIVKRHIKQVKNLFVWSEQTFSSFYETGPDIRYLVDELGRTVPVDLVKNPRSVKLKVWIFDVFRDPELIGDKSQLGADRIDADWRIASFKPILERIHPRIEVYVHFSERGDIEHFKNWYKDPKQFRYERIY